MALLDKLKETGWFLTEDGIQKLSGNKSSAKDVIDKALDFDLRDIGGSGLPKTETKQGRSQSFEGNVVVQIMKVRNIAAPKANEESKAAPRLLLLEFTDGQNTSYGLEIENIPSLSLNIAPGTKILLTKGPIPIYQNHLMLSAQNIKVLGGSVAALAEKWELTRSMAKFAKGGRINSGSQPPPWIPFGQKIQQGDLSGDKAFKSLASDKKSETKKENDDFDALRSEAIAEAAKAAKAKTFGCGGKQMLDHNVKKIMDRGYSEEEAKFALKLTRNNLERAMQNLKRRDERNQDSNNGEPFPARNGRDRRGRSQMDEDEIKPSGPVSLFEFFETKLPQTAAAPSAPTSAPPLAKTTSNFTNRSQPPVNVRGPPPSRSAAKIPPQTSAHSRTAPSNRDVPAPHSTRAPQTAINNDSASAKSKHFNPFAGPMPQSQNYSRNQSINKENYSSDQKSKSMVNNSDKDSDRSKFQNNMSASFAKRDNKPALGRENAYSGYDTSSKPRSNNFDQHQNGPRYQNDNQNSRPSHGKGPRSSNNDHFAKTAPPDVGYSQNKNSKTEDRRNIRPPPNSGRYQPPAQESVQQMNSLISSTANMAISNSDSANKKPQHTPMTAHSSNEKQPAVPYNPYKIMGFQNKETNEYAMNLMKGQMFIQQPAMPMPMQMPQNHVPPPQYHTFVAAYPMEQAPPPTQMATRNWVIGEECLAKYWEDGQFYKATITNVSKKTCVVNFPEYGNYEEVLQADCLPISDANNMGMIPPVHSDAVTTQQTMMNMAQPPMNSNSQSYPSRHFNAGPKYRFERKVYVPPAQRDK